MQQLLAIKEFSYSNIGSRPTSIIPYVAPLHLSRHRDGQAHAASYLEEGGYICPSDIFYGRVKRAVNTFGQWKVVVNLPDNFRHDPKYKQYVQTSRLESCA